MTEQERTEMETLSKKEDRTEQENKRYKELLERFLEGTLYTGGTEDDET